MLREKNCRGKNQSLRKSDFSKYYSRFMASLVQDILLEATSLASQAPVLASTSSQLFLANRTLKLQKILSLLISLNRFLSLQEPRQKKRHVVQLRSPLR